MIGCTITVTLREGEAADPGSSIHVKKPIDGGLYVENTNEAQFRKLIENALKGGASGVSLFSAAKMTATHWKALRRIPNSEVPSQRWAS